jgi:Protein of unknown function (DUF2817)
MKPVFPVQADFTAQRERFLDAARAAGATVTTVEHPLRGPAGEALATDVAWLGDPGARRVLVSVSGTHGVEGYYGSTCQTAWLHEFSERDMPKGVAVLMVHLINPWGTAWVRRVNEDNVDLNRNYLDFGKPLPRNERYESIHAIFTCRDIDGPERRRADELQADRVRAMGWREYSSIVGAGQYDHADGVYYGGQQATWSNRTLRSIVEKNLKGVDTAIAFDLHTGAGPFGYPLLMAIAENRYPALDDASALYGPWLTTIVTGAGERSDTGVVATATGYTSQAMLDALPGTRLMQLVIECGTYEEVPMNKALRDDHWLHLYGDPTDETGRQIKRELLECFLPADLDWRDTVWQRTRQIWERALSRLSETGKAS